MPARPRTVTRRTTLAVGGLSLVAVGGCDDSKAPAPPRPTPPPDPDAALVDHVLAHLADAERLTRAAGLRELAALHRAHIAVLDGDPPRGHHRRRRPDAAEVRRAEQLLQRRLVKAAVEARSGRLARLLASMSAAVSQRLATLQRGSA